MSKPEGESGHEKTIRGNFVVTHNLTDKRGLTITEYITSEDDPKGLSARIDSAMNQLDRQSIRADLVAKRAQVAGLYAQLEHAAEWYGAMVEKQKKVKLVSAEKKQVDDYANQVKAMKKTIESVEAAIAAGEKKLAEE